MEQATHIAIELAVAKAREKHGTPEEISVYADIQNPKNKKKLFAILDEEVQEFKNALYYESPERANDELLDIIAVAVRILEGR